VLGVGEHRDHVGGLTLSFDFGDAVEFSKVIRIAGGVGDGFVLAGGGPVVVDQDARKVPEHPHCVHGGRAPLLVEMIEREQLGRGQMYPVQRGNHP
jgi:hypothetical protein